MMRRDLRLTDEQRAIQWAAQYQRDQVRLEAERMAAERPVAVRRPARPRIY